MVQAYLIHIADRSDSNFRKILDLKGIRKQEQSSLVDLFNAHCMAPNNMNLPANSPFLTPLQVTGTAHTTSASSALRDASGTPGLSGGRFDPATFGSALMNVAREGVDRLGTPNIGSVESSSGSPSLGLEGNAGTNLNENLRSFGMFFRREGGFGRFGRGAGGTESGSVSR